MKPLRLLAIIEASTITGPAKNLLEFARTSRGAGVETIIATFTRSSDDNLFIRTARQSGIPIETIRETGPFDAAAMRALAQLVDRIRPDIIQTHAVKSHFLARRAGLPRYAPWVAFHHGYTWPTLRARAYNQFDRWSLRAADKVLTVSIPFRRELTAHGVKPDRIEIVHNAIPSGWGASAHPPADLGIPGERKVILIVGRLSAEKDHLTLVNAVNALRPRADPHLAIVGDGPERGRIEKLVARLGLTDRVTFAGQQDSAEPYYAMADVAVLSSLSEGSPNALLEAMAAGVPVVATAVGGIPEIVTDGESALLVRPGDVGAMSTAIARLLVDEPLALAVAERSRTLIRERHTPEGRMRRLVEIYRRVRRG
ncbi:MAG TPA: glycosyltransferase [Bryobacteraceae bacterium]|nr:glycosyltransferase [Bryobacteraceae bacterium]